MEVLFRGKSVAFEFPYRKPWPWLRTLLMDETLKDHIMYHSVFKTFRDENGQEVRVIDETNTADSWWNMDVSRPLLVSTFPEA